MRKLFILLGAFLLMQVSQVNAQATKESQTKKSTLPAKASIELKITGMTCAGCSDHIANALQKTNGIVAHTVKYPGNMATIQYDPATINPQAIVNVIERAGYHAEIMNTTQTNKIR
ncbi:MAG: heavy-metal-associated domain-containing protein [Chitinophagales bacterium]